MKTVGPPKFDSIVVGEIQVNYMEGPNVRIEAQAAFVSSETGATHGWTRGEASTWSAETITRLLSLKESMERDLAARHFSGGEGSAGGKDGVRFDADKGGIGEHVAGEDAPSV